LDSLPPSPILSDGAAAAQFLTNRLRAQSKAMPAASQGTWETGS
jgi:hypothetical protein